MNTRLNFNDDIREWVANCFWAFLEKKKKNIQTSTLRSSQCQKPAGQSQANIQALSLHGWMMPRYDSLLFFVFLASNVWTFTCYTFNDCLKHWQSIHWLQVGRNNLLKTTQVLTKTFHQTSLADGSMDDLIPFPLTYKLIRHLNDYVCKMSMFTIEGSGTESKRGLRCNWTNK